MHCINSSEGRLYFQFMLTTKMNIKLSCCSLLKTHQILYQMFWCIYIENHYLSFQIPIGSVRKTEKFVYIISHLSIYVF